MELVCVTIDCHDPEPVARFWNDALRWGHLGLHAGTLVELEAEITRLVGLGASIAWEEEFPPDIAARFRNVILRDPEGNEFCLGGGALR